MTKVVCAVFDSAVQAYSQPFFVRSTGEAVRSFSDEVNRPDQANALYQHPDDYILWQLATFNDDEGIFLAEKRVLVRGKDAIKEKQS